MSGQESTRSAARVESPLDRFRLDGRVALVTGASGGLGAHFARVLAAVGARVAVTARRRERLEALASEIQASGGEALVTTLDVCDEASIAHAFAEAETTLGAVEIVVNNSGVATTVPAIDLAGGDWDTVLDTNLRGAWLVAREAARRLVAVGHPGTIINIASILAFRVAGGVAPYAASKAGLVQLTRALALEWARHGIRVNAIAPGYVLTDISRGHFATPDGQAMLKRIPQRRIGTPEDLDGALLLLASDASTYMTGAAITIDGGHLQSSL